MYPGKIIRLFISHSWDHNDDYESLVQLLHKIKNFEFYNYSVPEHDPLTADGDKELMQELCEQLRGCHVLIVIASMYPSYSEWIQKEVLIANVYGKPVLGVIPRGQKRISKFVITYADKLVRWNSRSIHHGIRELMENDNRR
ncbi:MAG: TIR domain-containing protein [Candidatus Heimdallarchaeota archaeon]|nr:TIR domain-containing protein [Candidatus Heimdallarchaeota archaeon]MBY8994897.1 TIR domain-containing protein [Candidatus Heimdallarchaeota archaeon]